MKLKQAAIAVLTGVSLLATGFWFGSVSASTSEPGSAGDPLVSKSYVDSLVTFQVVTIPKDATLLGESGTEIVLRGGQAVAVVSLSGGILDVSDGTDVGQDEPIKPNHLLIIPRSDGRGLLATSDVIVLIKGAFVVNAPAQPR